MLDNGYKAPNSCAEAVTKLFPEKDRAGQVTLDIGAGTGLLAEEVSVTSTLHFGYFRDRKNCRYGNRRAYYLRLFFYILTQWKSVILNPLKSKEFRIFSAPEFSFMSKKINKFLFVFSADVKERIQNIRRLRSIPGNVGYCRRKGHLQKLHLRCDRQRTPQNPRR